MRHFRIVYLSRMTMTPSVVNLSVITVMWRFYCRNVIFIAGLVDTVAIEVFFYEGVFAI